MIAGSVGGGVSDHGELTGLTDDDHSIYALLAGRSGGQTLIGGTGSGDDLTLQSTNHATKGSILFGTSAYDEVNNMLGIGLTNPSVELEVSKSVNGSVQSLTRNSNNGASAWTGVNLGNDTGTIGFFWTGSSNYTTAAFRDRFAIESSATNATGLTLTAKGAASDLLLQSGGYNDRMLIESTGLISMGGSHSALGQVHIHQTSTTAAIQVLVLDRRLQHAW